ncbi:MAG TPA: ParB/RepB/Spo0J family partition protein [Candidatus Acidoferrales bacterium]|jgi:ParB family transcriptional regulator, chromosome partitioning protein|nr:ParB/RepB/Spo0J family partition protein [Candidatus Acidoferrales bacterium]
MTMANQRPHGLGRGLAALIPQRAAQGPGTVEIPLDRIRENPRQPRLRMADDALATLAASIREHGVIQPILVTETIDGYQLVAGERRVRAARIAGLDHIPAVIRQLADREQLELALVENLQREDLDPIEAARAYRQLIDEFAFSQEDLATRVGRARSTVANTLRLLDLHPAVQAAVAAGDVTEGHARALGGLPNDSQARVLDLIVERDLSVRQAEELVRRVREPRQAAPSTAPAPRDPDLDRVEEDLRRALGTKVRLAKSRKGGRIVIEYYSPEELERLYDRIVGTPA